MSDNIHHVFFGGPTMEAPFERALDFLKDEQLVELPQGAPEYTAEDLHVIMVPPTGYVKSVTAEVSEPVANVAFTLGLYDGEQDRVVERVSVPYSAAIRQTITIPFPFPPEYRGGGVVLSLHGKDWSELSIKVSADIEERGLSHG